MAVSNFIVKQDGDICCCCLGIVIFALEKGNLLLERSPILF
jgi:hypothetical protein